VSEPGGRRAMSPAASDHGGAGASAAGGPDEPPPVLGRWSRLYALVAFELVAIILALYWLTRRFD